MFWIGAPLQTAIRHNFAYPESFTSHVQFVDSLDVIAGFDTSKVAWGYTPSGSSGTKLSENELSKLAFSRETSITNWNAVYANAILHEVFWLGLFGDDMFGLGAVDSVIHAGSELRFGAAQSGRIMNLSDSDVRDLKLGLAGL